MSSNCPHVGTLQAYLDGQLEDQEQRIAAHLSACDRCSAALQKLRVTAVQVDGLLDTLAEEAVPPVVVPLPRRAPYRRVAIEVAACLALAAGLLIVRNESAQPPANVAGNTPLSAGGDLSGFVPQPGFDPALPTGKLMVVRVELPASAFEPGAISKSPMVPQTGVPADVLMDEDGTLYAVRLAVSAGKR